MTEGQRISTEQCLQLAKLFNLLERNDKSFSLIALILKKIYEKYTFFC